LPSNEGTQIVLVEDDADDVALAQRLVARSPVPVSLIVVRDGADALDLLNHRVRSLDSARPARPHLILLDIGLPGIDGIEVLRRVKAEPQLKDIPTILLSGSRDEGHIRQGQELGAHSHLMKPLSLQDFAWIATSVRNYWKRVSILQRLTR